MLQVTSTNPTRLDRFLRRNLGQIPQSIIEKEIRSGRILVNGVKQPSNYRLQKDDQVSYPEFDIEPEENAKNYKLHEKFRTWIVHEDDDICIIDKPYGLSTQGGEKILHSVDSMANNGDSKYYIVHRLDRHTTGLLLLARNVDMAILLSKTFRQKTIQKYYVAIVEGKPARSSGLIYAPIGAIQVQGVEKMIVTDEGKRACTRFRIVKEVAPNKYLLLLKPYTGRKHQLRVHLQAIGTPIVGDRKYNSEDEKGRMYLHAYKIILADGRAWKRSPNFLTQPLDQA